MALTDCIPPLERFLEANRAIRRDRKLARPGRRLQTAVAAAFRKQGRLFLRSLGQLRSRFDANAALLQETAPSASSTPLSRSGQAVLRETVSPADWLPFWDAAVRDTRLDLNAPLQAAILDAFVLGGRDLFADLKLPDDELDELGIAWNLENPRAVLYAQQHAAAQVSRLNSSTRSYLNALISSAVTEGWSYNKLSQAIGNRFSEFATGGPNPRSRRVAVFELGDAYEAGNAAGAQELTDAGLTLEKKWLTAGDGKVRPSHRENQAEGFIPLSQQHSSGHDRPPTDSGCRCTELYRRKQG